MYKRNNDNVACQLLRQVDDNKTRMKWHKILISDVMTLSKWLKSNQVPQRIKNLREECKKRMEGIRGAAEHLLYFALR